MIYTMEQIKAIVKTVADKFDIEELLLFGSYFDGRATEDSDLDFVVRYGDGCRGLECISFMLALEDAFGKEVDVINIDFQPKFMREMNLQDERRKIYTKDYGTRLRETPKSTDEIRQSRQHVRNKKLNDFLKEIDIETVIQQVDGSMAIEGMALSDEDKERIRQTAFAPDKVETVIQELVEKHSVNKK